MIFKEIKVKHSIAQIQLTGIQRTTCIQQTKKNTRSCLLPSLMLSKYLANEPI